MNNAYVLALLFLQELQIWILFDCSTYSTSLRV